MDAHPPGAPALTPQQVRESVAIVQEVLRSGAPIDDEAWEHDAAELLRRLGPVWDRRRA